LFGGWTTRIEESQQREQESHLVAQNSCQDGTCCQNRRQLDAADRSVWCVVSLVLFGSESEVKPTEVPFANEVDPRLDFNPYNGRSVKPVGALTAAAPGQSQDTSGPIDAFPPGTPNEKSISIRSGALPFNAPLRLAEPEALNGVPIKKAASFL